MNFTIQPELDGTMPDLARSYYLVESVRAPGYIDLRVTISPRMSREPVWREEYPGLTLAEALDVITAQESILAES